MIRWYLTLLASVYCLMQPNVPAGATMFFGGLAGLAVYRLGGYKWLRAWRIARRTARRSGVGRG
ncbi:hypothetical protein [Xanthomonas campestris]|uniref:hypothetical protein n=1 Tax=Xanthomonas campestris TaxID=339 RepID=UPI003557F0EC